VLANAAVKTSSNGGLHLVPGTGAGTGDMNDVQNCRGSAQMLGPVRTGRRGSLLPREGSLYARLPGRPDWNLCSS
jgi:hypothetical protein